MSFSSTTTCNDVKPIESMVDGWKRAVVQISSTSVVEATAPRLMLSNKTNGQRRPSFWYRVADAVLFLARETGDSDVSKGGMGNILIVWTMASFPAQAGEDALLFERVVQMKVFRCCSNVA